jgi:hypothetical protein
MRTVVRLELADEVLDVKIDGGLRDTQAGRNFLVLAAIPNEPQDIEFPLR